MLSKARQKLIASLVQKKQRDIHGLFLAEGPRMIHDLIQSGLHPQFLVGTDQWTAEAEISKKNPETIIVTANEFKKISLLKTPQHVLGVFPKPENHFNNNAIKSGLILVLDGIQDPGNMGTIIRLADWFGIGNIVCSIDTVDVYNPKVVQASMGALVKVTVHYTNLPAFLNTYGKSCKNPVYGAFLEYRTHFHCIGCSSKGRLCIESRLCSARCSLLALTTTHSCTLAHSMLRW